MEINKWIWLIVWMGVFFSALNTIVLGLIYGVIVEDKFVGLCFPSTSFIFILILIFMATVLGWVMKSLFNIKIPEQSKLALLTSGEKHDTN